MQWWRRLREGSHAVLRGGLGTVFRAAGRVLLASLLGLLLGVLVAGFDRWTGLTLPTSLQNARTLLSGLVSAIMTVAVFTLWMRSVVAGMASGQVSPRIVTGYLEDRFQWHLLYAMAALFTFIATGLLGLPSGQEQSAPALTTTLAVVTVVGALLMVLVALHNAVQRLSLPRLVRTLADQAAGSIEDDPAPDDPWPAGHLPAPETRIRTCEVGWVQRIDHVALLARLPPGAQLDLHVDPGSFVGPGDVLATCDARLDAATRERLLEQITVRPDRAPVTDMAFAFQQLRDLAQQAMGARTADTSTAHEALLYLGVLLTRLIDRGPLSGNLLGSEGRAVTTHARWSVRDHLAEVLEPLVQAATDDPLSLRQIGILLHDLEHHAGRRGDEDSQVMLGSRRGTIASLLRAKGARGIETGDGQRHRADRRVVAEPDAPSTPSHRDQSPTAP